MSASDPYHEVGLQRNPFVVEQELVIPAELWLDRKFPPAPEPGQQRLIQIIGPPGTGKSSLLFHWREQVPGPYCHYPPGLRRFRMPPLASLAYWDEADRIPKPILNLALRRAARIAATLVCGTHEDLAERATRCGLAVDTVEPPPISPTELITWANLRIRRMQLAADQPVPLQLTPEEAGKIAGKSGHSWRIAADELHVWTARTVDRLTSEQTDPIEVPRTGGS